MDRRLRKEGLNSGLSGLLKIPALVCETRSRSFTGIVERGKTNGYKMHEGCNCNQWPLRLAGDLLPKNPAKIK